MKNTVQTVFSQLIKSMPAGLSIYRKSDETSWLPWVHVKAANGAIVEIEITAERSGASWMGRANGTIRVTAKVGYETNGYIKIAPTTDIKTKLADFWTVKFAEAAAAQLRRDESKNNTETRRVRVAEDRKAIKEHFGVSHLSNVSTGSYDYPSLTVSISGLTKEQAITLLEAAKALGIKVGD